MSDQPDLFSYVNFIEVREKFFKDLHAGEKKDCPCCGRYTQLYKRQISSSMAQQAITVLRLGGDSNFVHLSTVLKMMSDSKKGSVLGGFEFTKLAYWGLAESKARNEDDTHKKTSGLWKLTEKGVLYVTGLKKISKYAVIYNDEVIRFEGEQVDISYALGTFFDYQQLMEGI